MKCPTCHKDTEVFNTRRQGTDGGVIYRRRRCLGPVQHRFTTYEEPENGLVRTVQSLRLELVRLRKQLADREAAYLRSVAQVQTLRADLIEIKGDAQAA